MRYERQSMPLQEAFVRGTSVFLHVTHEDGGGSIPRKSALQVKIASVARESSAAFGKKLDAQHRPGGE